MFDDADTTARFFFLSLLGLFIAWSVFLGGGYKLKQGVRDAAIWVLIFVTAITLYAFKDTFLAQVYPSAGRMLDERTIQLAKGADGAFHATLLINGQRIETLVDTGASDLVLTRADAARVGLDVEELNFWGQASTANGIVSTAFVTLESVRLGEITDFDVRARVNGGELDESLLGMSYLERFSTWQVEGDTLILRR